MGFHRRTDFAEIGTQIQLLRKFLARLCISRAHKLHAVLKIQNKTKLCVSNPAIQPVNRASYSVSNQKEQKLKQPDFLVTRCFVVFLPL